MIYPEKKEFPDKESAGYSLLPLQEKNFEVDLTGYTPIELSMVKIADIFVGHEEFTDMDKIMWSYGINGDDFTISTSGDTVDMNGSSYYQMIVGKDDQLDSSNIRYMISVDKTSTYKWLIPSIYVQKEDGERREIIISRVYYSADSVNIHFSRGGLSESDKIHIGLALNTEVFQNPKFDHVRAFEGRFKTLDEALLGNDITDQVWEVDMSQKDSGYWMKWEIDRDWSYEYITLVTFDAEGNATGFVSVDLTIWGDKIDWGDLQAVIYTQDEEGNRDMITINSNSYSDNLD